MTDPNSGPSHPGDETQAIEPAWQPLTTTQRRVFGVLIEKAKTTPDAYPLTINAVTTGSNQKSNRSPLMTLEPIDVENSLDELRSMGAVSEVHGSGRMSKYRHRVYEWMGIDKVEAAVMAELLLRGEQTIGELRGRAGRMERIAGVAELKPILHALMQKGLVQALTPEGRGQVVTHCLYTPDQQTKLESRFSSEGHSISAPAAVSQPASSIVQDRAPAGPQAEAPLAKVSDENVEFLQNEIESLKETVADLEKRLQNLEQMIN